MIPVICKKCGRDFDASDRSAGSTEECPGCMSPVTVPKTGAAAEPQYLEEIPVAKTAPAAALFKKDNADNAMTSSAKPHGLRKTCKECGSYIQQGKGICPDCGTTYVSSRTRESAASTRGDSFALERSAFNYGAAGGLLMIAIAGIWFFAGLAAGYIFFYPPVLAIIGIAAVFKGLFTGNIAGGRRKIRQRRIAR